MADETIIEKEMGITHEEFFRNIARALPAIDFQKNETGVTVDDGDKHLDISLSEQGERRIALMRVPITRVKLTFQGYDEADTGKLLDTFDRAFQRGGG